MTLPSKKRGLLQVRLPRSMYMTLSCTKKGTAHLDLTCHSVPEVR